MWSLVGPVPVEDVRLLVQVHWKSSRVSCLYPQYVVSSNVHKPEDVVPRGWREIINDSGHTLHRSLQEL